SSSVASPSSPPSLSARSSSSSATDSSSNDIDNHPTRAGNTPDTGPRSGRGPEPLRSRDPPASSLRLHQEAEPVRSDQEPGDVRGPGGVGDHLHRGDRQPGHLHLVHHHLALPD